MKRLFSILIILLVFAGCSGPRNEEAAPAFEVDIAPQSVDQMATNKVKGTTEPSSQVEGKASAVNEVVAERKFVKTGRIEFETDDATAARRTIMESVKASKGYVSKDDEDRSGSAVSYTIIVHVPAASFDTFLASATKGVTDFRQKSVSNEDVTAQYVDTESRLKTKKEIENRYRALLSKANSVSDILEIERELGEIRTDIEATEAQFRQLNGDIKYSTLHIVFFKSVDTSNPFLTELADAFKEGVANLRAFTVVLVAVWPFVLLAIGVLAVLNWLRNRRKKMRKETTELSPQ